LGGALYDKDQWIAMVEDPAVSGKCAGKAWVQWVLVIVGWMCARLMGKLLTSALFDQRI